MRARTRLSVDAVDGRGSRLPLNFVVGGETIRIGRQHAQVPDLTTAIHLVALVCQSFGVPILIRSNAEMPLAITEWAEMSADRIADAIDLSTSRVRQGACRIEGVEHLVVQLEDAGGRQAHMLFTCDSQAAVLGDERVGVPTLGQALRLAAELLGELREAGMPVR